MDSGAGSGAVMTGATLSTIGAGAGSASGAGAGGAALGGVGLAFATFFFAFGATCLGADSATNAGFSVTTSWAGTGAGADGISAATSSTGVWVTGADSGLVAQADRIRTERIKAAGKAILSVLGMEFSRNTVGDMTSGQNLPTDILSPANNLVPQTIKFQSFGCLHLVTHLPQYIQTVAELRRARRCLQVAVKPYRSLARHLFQCARLGK